MAEIRINGLANTAQTASNDDYVVLDGATNGTRKMLAKKLTEGIEQQLTTTNQNVAQNTEDITDLKEDISNISHSDSVTVNSGSFVKLSAYFRSTGTISADEDTKTLYFECLPNAVYAINKILSARFRVGYTTVIPAVGVTVYGFKEDNNAISLKLTTGGDAHYVVVYYYDGNNDTLTEAEIFNSIRITGKVNMTAIDRVAREEISQIEPGLSDDAKIALLNCFAHVAWTDGQGQAYYNALEAALCESAYPRITAVFNSGSNTIYTDDPISTLKQYITVTYYETEQSEGTVIPSESYTLSGVLTEGVSTIGVTYNNVSTTVTIPNVVDFYNIWTWNLGDGRLQKVVGSVDMNQSDTTKYPSKAFIRTDVTTRRNFNTSRGILPYYLYNQTAVSSGYYPIPVPKDANHMKITLTPSTQYINAQVCAYNSSNNTYNNSLSQNRIGWAAGLGGGEIDIDRPNNEQSMFLVINTKYDSAGTSYPTEPTGLTIEFSEVTP